MVNTCITLIILSSMILLAIPSVLSLDQDPVAVEQWFENLPNMTPKLTHLHFYLHDLVSGSDPTVFRVAQSNITSSSPTAFGFIAMADDMLTTGPEPNSTVLGRAQGIYGSACLEESGLLMTMNLVFTGADYNGSTLSLLGRNAVFHRYREMPIVGGSGVFRMARGVATAKTYEFNLTSGDAVVEYNVMVQHYN
ncbi:putative dirigent protein [Helianthus annuus]|uniref:Dirigent protein n=1 Tax=Helianthus annuus TaxID=4232 RepID=A0A251SCF4_HELAN|nr:dirigent protein 22 [Helianthus annuus]KAF5764406.1 putative dirigent protein [Helianthus annuus]KAJ0451093.1 putative dirigent protein [Helianthus annuus]KAJ0455488.1 putative dirigent protein [Helianthus annuus]KAJ0472953.1 putative dirigent protein [Helianthus annuus]KAJ0648558.1 putative dirigent protein [Helianthus annuus]